MSARIALAGLALVAALWAPAGARAQSLSLDMELRELALELSDFFERWRRDRGGAEPVVSVSEVTERNRRFVCQPLSRGVREGVQSVLSNRSVRLDRAMSLEQRQSLDGGALRVSIGYERFGDEVSLSAEVYSLESDNAFKVHTAVRRVGVDRLDRDSRLCVTPDDQALGLLQCTPKLRLTLVDAPSRRGREMMTLQEGAAFEVLESYNDATSLLVRLMEAPFQNAERPIGFLNASLRDLDDPRRFDCLGATPSRDSFDDRDIVTDCDRCPEMVVVPLERFRFGSRVAEAGRQSDEDALREERLDRRFAMGRTEVTVGQWRACAEAGACEAARIAPGTPDDLPVAVSYADAEAYAGWLSAETRARYRLPTEAEWEHAARGGRDTRYHWGDLLVADRAACRNCASPGSAPVVRAQSVGTFRENDFRLYDVHGNLWEWTSTCARDAGPGCERRLLKGGSYRDDAVTMRVGNRHAAPVDALDDSVGFRVLREIER